MLEGKVVRERDQALGIRQNRFRIGALDAGKRDSIAGLYVSDALADGSNDAGTLNTHGERERAVIGPTPLPHVQEVHPCGDDADHCLAWGRRLERRDIDQPQDFGSAQCLHSD